MTDPPAPRRLEWRTAEVREVIEETPHARSLVLHVPGWPGHLPGQHVDVRLTAEDGYQAQRSYSIASPPEADALVLTVERIEDGEVSPYLTGEARPGDTIELRGPIGGYFVWTAAVAGPLQLLAGGSGIVPLMAMLRHRALRARHVPARLLYSSRSREFLLYKAELDQLTRDDERLQVVRTLTRESPPDWIEMTGRVDAAMLHELVFPPDEKPQVFICGPTPFVEAVADHLVALGHAAPDIKTERFGPTGQH